MNNSIVVRYNTQYYNKIGWVEVQWDHGKANSYRMGAEGKFDLELTGEDPAIPPPPSDESSESISTHDASDEVTFMIIMIV